MLNFPVSWAKCAKKSAILRNSTRKLETSKSRAHAMHIKAQLSLTHFCKWTYITVYIYLHKIDRISNILRHFCKWTEYTEPINANNWIFPGNIKFLISIYKIFLLPSAALSGITKFSIQLFILSLNISSLVYTNLF